MILVKFEYEREECPPKHFILDGRKLYFAKCYIANIGMVRPTYAYIYKTEQSPVDKEIDKKHVLEALYNGVMYAMHPRSKKIEFQNEELKKYFNWNDID